MTPYLQCGQCIGVNQQNEIVLCTLRTGHTIKGHWNLELTEGAVNLFEGVEIVDAAMSSCLAQVSGF